MSPWSYFQIITPLKIPHMPYTQCQLRIKASDYGVEYKGLGRGR